MFFSYFSHTLMIFFSVDIKKKQHKIIYCSVYVVKEKKKNVIVDVQQCIES